MLFFFNKKLVYENESHLNLAVINENESQS